MWLSYLAIFTLCCLDALSNAHGPNIYHNTRRESVRSPNISSSFHVRKQLKSCFVQPGGRKQQEALKNNGNLHSFSGVKYHRQIHCNYKQNDHDIEGDSKPSRRNGSKKRKRNSMNSSSNDCKPKYKRRQQSRRGRNSSYNDIFTRTLVAPPLERRQPSNGYDDDDNNSILSTASFPSPGTKNGVKIQKFHREDDVLSPSVMERNEENCMAYICGELPVTYTNDCKTINAWLMDNVNDNYTGESSAYTNTFLGFDVEAAPTLPWRTPMNANFIGRPATVQLSTPYSSLVVHLSNKDVISPLEALLSDRSILKVGAGVDEDMLELFRWNQSLDAKGRFDIGGVGSNSKRSRVGLQKLVRAIVGVELPKSKKTAMSDWSKIPLSSKQLIYASRDAWAGAAVMENLGRFHREKMHVDLISSLIQENEREMSDVDDRARRRKNARMKTKKIIADTKELASFLDGDKHSKFDRQSRLQDIMPKEVKEEMDRLQVTLDETAPDGLLFFDPKELGLDFSFVEKGR